MAEASDRTSPRRFKRSPRQPRAAPTDDDAEAEDHIQILPRQQLIPIVQTLDAGAGAGATPSPPPQLATRSNLETPEQRQRREADERQRREAELQRRRERREQESNARQQTIQAWRPILHDEEVKCNHWAQEGIQQDHSVEATLGRQLRHFWTTTRPSPRQTAGRNAIVAAVQNCINRAWPGKGLHVTPFGSSVTGIVSADSDIDLALLDQSRPFGVGTPSEMQVRFAGLSDEEDSDEDGLPSWYDVRNVAKALRKYGFASGRRALFSQVVPISGANVPIVKFKDASTAISLDLSVNDRFGLINSKMIHAYATLREETFRPLCFAVKMWLKRRGLNNPSGEGGSGSSLSSYSIVLLVIQYYQSERLLPSLQNDALLASQSVERSYIYRAPKFRRRRAGDPKPASLLDDRQREVVRYDVTFLDVSQPQKRGVADPAGWTYWLREGDDEQRRLAQEIDKEQWDEQRRAHPDKFGSLPPAADVGLHRRAECEQDARVSLGRDFMGFIAWYNAVDKRSSVIDIKHGAPRKSNTIQTRRAWQAANGLGDGIPTGTIDTDASAPSSGATGEDSESGGGAGEQILVPGSQPAPKATDHDPDQPLEWESDRIVIRDPFILDRNTAKNIHRVVADRIDFEFNRATQMIQDATAAFVEQRQRDEGEGPLLLSDLWMPIEYLEAVAREEHEQLRQKKRQEVALAQAAGAIGDAGAAINGGTSASGSDLEVDLSRLGIVASGKGKRARRGGRTRGVLGTAPPTRYARAPPQLQSSSDGGGGTGSGNASLPPPRGVPTGPRRRDGMGGSRSGSGADGGGGGGGGGGYTTTSSNASSFGSGRGRGRGGSRGRGGKYRGARRGGHDTAAPVAAGGAASAGAT